MNSLLALVSLNLAVALSLMIIVWLVSLRLSDVSIIDIAWGAAGAAIALVTCLATGSYTARSVVLTGMATLWGLRLAIHIGIRKKGKPEDFRYAAMRAAHPETFPVRSLVTVFSLQAVLIWIITMPVQVASFHGPSDLGFLDWLGSFVWIVGFTVEILADAQLRSFLADSTQAGKVMDRGLWRYSRHPNYFGESLVWWGIYLVAASTPWGKLTVFSPILMTYFLLEISGVPMLEKALAERREGYRAYMERTSRFIPWAPRR